MSDCADIWNWLKSIDATEIVVTDEGDENDPYSDSERPHKRARLHEGTQRDTYEVARDNDSVDCTTRAARPIVRQPLPTPSLSTSTPSVLSRKDGNGECRLMSTSPSKRPWDSSLELGLTPCPLRTGAAANDREDCSVTSTPSYTSSSKASKASRTSSPTKQILQAELQQTGFRQASFAFDPQPPSLQALCRDLKRIYNGDGILPMRLKEEYMELELPEFFFCDNPDTVARRYPQRGLVCRILRRANECDLDGKGESSWNMDVHAPVLDWVLEGDSNNGGCLDSEYCTTAGLLREYRPKNAPSKMVDFCLTIRPKLSEEQDLIDTIRCQRPGNSINHTDWGALRKHPIAISIETKRHGEHYDAALLQIATWHSAQWRSLSWVRQGEVNHPHTIEFLAGLIVQGHDWQFVPSILGDDAISKVMRPPLQIGDTRSEAGILKLFSSLQRLKQDAEETYWPAFKASVLGIPTGTARKRV